MKDLFEEFEGLLEELDLPDELVMQNHVFVEHLNKRYNHKIRMPYEFGVKAS